MMPNRQVASISTKDLSISHAKYLRFSYSYTPIRNISRGANSAYTYTPFVMNAKVNFPLINQSSLEVIEHHCWSTFYIEAL